MVNRYSQGRWRFDAIRGHDGHDTMGVAPSTFVVFSPISFPFSPSKKVLKFDAAQRAKLKFLFTARVYIYHFGPPKHKVFAF